jgi:hypothetical protein
VKTKNKLESTYVMRSEDVISRDVEGKLIIVPIISDVGDLEGELFTLNKTGRAIWESLDGKRSLREVVDSLSRKFNGSVAAIEKDVLGLLKELLRRRMVVEVKQK